jgi:hypothetical protein
VDYNRLVFDDRLKWLVNYAFARPPRVAALNLAVVSQNCVGVIASSQIQMSTDMRLREAWSFALLRQTRDRLLVFLLLGQAAFHERSVKKERQVTGFSSAIYFGGG